MVISILEVGEAVLEAVSEALVDVTSLLEVLDAETIELVAEGS